MMKAWLAAAVLCGLLAAPVAAQDLTEEQQKDATEFALNNSIFVLEHEIGHLFVGEFGLPVLGKEEDAADSLASLMLLRQKTDASQQALIDAADGWSLMENSKAGDSYEDADFYDEHSLDIQRAFQVVCLMVGADPTVFSDIANEYQMDPERQDGCAYDYQQLNDSWTGLLAPHVKTDKPGPAIAVSYEPSDNFQDIADYLKSVKFLETAAAGVDQPYVLPRPLTFVAKECGEENAFYVKDDAGITFCYEMFTLFFDLASDNILQNPST